jgi:tyrosinase
VESHGVHPIDNLANARGDLSRKQRKEYIAAVLCLQKKKGFVSRQEYPGVRSRFDDFVAVHANQTMTIHSTVMNAETPASFLS